MTILSPLLIYHWKILLCLGLCVCEGVFAELGRVLQLHSLQTPEAAQPAAAEPDFTTQERAPSLPRQDGELEPSCPLPGLSSLTALPGAASRTGQPAPNSSAAEPYSHNSKATFKMSAWTRAHQWELGKRLSTFAFLLCMSLWVHQKACHSFPSGFSARCTPVPQWFWNRRSTAIRFTQWQN